jgi:hypothetical protein
MFSVVKLLQAIQLQAYINFKDMKNPHPQG